MKKQAGRAKAGRKRVAVKDLGANKGGARGGGLFGLQLPAVQQKVRETPRLPRIADGTSNTLLNP